MIEIQNINRIMFQNMKNVPYMYVCKIKEGIVKGVGGPYKNVQNHAWVLLFHIASISSPTSAKID